MSMENRIFFFLKKIGQRLVHFSGDDSAAGHFWQRTSVAIQRWIAVGSLSSLKTLDVEFEEVLYYNKIPTF